MARYRVIAYAMIACAIFFVFYKHIYITIEMYKRIKPMVYIDWIAIL